jgi:hypothetical protein
MSVTATQFDLRDKDLLRTLDAMSTEGLEDFLGPGSTVKVFAEGQGYWHVGDGHPALADDDPAVMQAIGRCAAARIRWGQGVIRLGSVHPGPCGWCGYPLVELLRALDWALYMGRLVTSERLAWRGRDRTEYVRVIRSEEWDNPAHAAFWALPADQREARIQAAVEASRS